MAELTGAPQIASVNTDDVSTTAKHPVGTRMFDASGNEYIYGKGVASTVKYDWVSFDEALQSSRLVANAKGRVGIAQAAIVANSFGWYLIYGTGLGNALSAYADNGAVYATATAGSVDDATVTGDLVVGAIGRSALSGATATFELSHPFVTDILG